MYLKCFGIWKTSLLGLQEVAGQSFPPEFRKSSVNTNALPVPGIGLDKDIVRDILKHSANSAILKFLGDNLMAMLLNHSFKS